MARSKSSKRWLKEHFDDPYVRRAQAEGLRSRACYKLEELQQKHRLIKPGMAVVDLGAAPGGWSQLAVRWLGGTGRVIALDLLEIEPIDGVCFIHGDFTEDLPIKALRSEVGDTLIDLVMSDLAPNISGMDAVDQPRAMYLAELTLDFAREHLKMNGSMLTKVFQGEGFDNYIREARSSFSKVSTAKPKASRPRSREVYVLARGYRGGQ